MNEPAKLSSLPARADAITEEYFIAHYAELLPRYISSRHPSSDTLNTYIQQIDTFLKWCLQSGYTPMSMHDYEMRIYMEHMRSHGYKDASISLNLSAVRIFYHIAMKLGLIKEHPCKDIFAHSSYTDDGAYLSFSPKQIHDIHKAMLDAAVSELEAARNSAMLYLMAIEGLRVVEVMRMNDEDINMGSRSIYVRGKGHDGFIYPSDETLNAIDTYLGIRPEPKKEGLLTPTFIAIGNRNKHGRITRNGIRLAMDKALKAAGYRQKGFVCHIFRHSCGTNLYAATKDLRLVQETLRQRDPKVTARYAHVQERMSKRYTSSIIYHEES